MSATIQIDSVYHWVGLVELPEQLRGGGPWHLTLADIERLMDGHDVMLRSEVETKRGIPVVASLRRVLWLDIRGGKFRPL
jgi:hypothetical protein